MGTARASADIASPIGAVYAVVADPTRLPEWDMTYEAATSVRRDPAGPPTFEVHRGLANRGMHLRCVIERNEPPTTFAFACRGDSGESIRETFSLAPGRDGVGTRFTRELDFELGTADPLGEIPALTYTQAWLDRSVEQAFAHLNVLLEAEPGVQPGVEHPPTAGAVDESPAAHPSSSGARRS